jgi:hypothetical protein
MDIMDGMDTMDGMDGMDINLVQGGTQAECDSSLSILICVLRVGEENHIGWGQTKD